MKVFACAGEASGDRLAVDLLAELERRHPRLAARGLAGPRMRAYGVEAVARAEDVTAVGLVEALAALPRVWGVRRALLAELDRWKPDLVVTIDSPGLLLPFARAARKRGFKVAHWVSPQVWAWRPGRVRSVARSVDALMCLFPFEPALYAGTGLDVTFTGHPAVDRQRQRPRTAGNGPSFALLPGSRPSEISALWPTFLEVAKRLRERFPECGFVVPVAPTVDRADLIGLDATFVDEVSAVDADAALVCSGTATLEIAAARIPQVVVYRVHPLTWALGRLLVRGVRHLALPNVLAGREVVPERLQELDPAVLADDLAALLGEKGRQQREDLAPILASLEPGAARRAADVVDRLAGAKASEPVR
jgi:lipid-A-disaccharide synthase